MDSRSLDDLRISGRGAWAMLVRPSDLLCDPLKDDLTLINTLLLLGQSLSKFIVGALCIGYLSYNWLSAISTILKLKKCQNFAKHSVRIRNMVESIVASGYYLLQRIKLLTIIKICARTNGS